MLAGHQPVAKTEQIACFSPYQSQSESGHASVSHSEPEPSSSHEGSNAVIVSFVTARIANCNVDLTRNMLLR